MTDNDATKHKFTIAPTGRGTNLMVSCSCGWRSISYNDKTTLVKRGHVIEVLAARAGITVEW